MASSDQLRESSLHNSGYYTVFDALPLPGSLKNRTQHANREIRLTWLRSHHIYTLPWLLREGVNPTTMKVHMQVFLFFFWEVWDIQRQGHTQ